MPRRSGGRGKAVLADMAGCAVVLAALGTAATGCSAGGTPTSLPKSTCGSAVTHDLSAATQLLSADKGALTCFANAARHCNAASLAVTELGVDTETRHVLTIKPGGKPCQVTELSQFYSANFGGSTSAIAATPCRLADATGAGVRLSCAGQDVLIPASVARP